MKIEKTLKKNFEGWSFVHHLEELQFSIQVIQSKRSFLFANLPLYRHASHSSHCLALAALGIQMASITLKCLRHLCRLELIRSVSIVFEAGVASARTRAFSEPLEDLVD